MSNDRKNRVQIIWAHPRVDSLTAKVVSAIKEEAAKLDIETSELDLYRRNFNPLITPVDEPDFQNPENKKYSAEVNNLAQELQGHKSAIIVYPVWWYSLPAMLKGYIERVWNYGLLYGRGKSLPFSSIRWVALVGGGVQRYEDEHWDKNMEQILNEGIAKYCGVNDSSVTFLYNTLAYEENTADLGAHHLELISQARTVVQELHDGWKKDFI